MASIRLQQCHNLTLHRDAKNDTAQKLNQLPKYSTNNKTIFLVTKNIHVHT